MAYLIVALAVLARLIPHVPHFSPVYGALLFGGAHLGKRESLWFPLLLLWGSDYLLTNVLLHLSIGWAESIQLLAFAAIILIGWLLRTKLSLQRFVFAGSAAPTAFYLISNFGVWLSWHTFPPTWSGLVQCYIAGIPYYGRSLGSTFLFAGILFGLHELRVRRSRYARSEYQVS